ncbi:OPA3-like protein [Gastrolobium bilobum]|uniref:OPA3-like protein n=1 Tax=Gastrolobium bilobum TaxID=150636 RepID=UPI002AB145E2|nr:OPA3-like protein [Gastrolobium bilobum]
MVAWPVIMLGTFALRTFSKPIANYLAKEAVGHPKIRQHVINIAQCKRSKHDHKAVGSGVDLLKEIFAFTVAGSAVIFKVSEARKEEERCRQEDELLEQEIELLREYNELLRERLHLIRELKRQKNKLVRQQELQHREDNELFGELFGEELQAINLKQNFFEETDSEHEEKLEIKQLATFGFILILMHTHGNEGRKSKSN